MNQEVFILKYPDAFKLLSRYLDNTDIYLFQPYSKSDQTCSFIESSQLNRLARLCAATT